MNYIAEIILIAANILMAAHHADLIEQDRPVKHGIWGGLYLLFTLVLCYGLTWWLLPVSLCLRKIVFDLSLNLFRGKPLLYVSKSSGSLLDKLHYKVFGDNIEIYMTLYLIKVVFLNIFCLGK